MNWKLIIIVAIVLIGFGGLQGGGKTRRGSNALQNAAIRGDGENNRKIEQNKGSAAAALIWIALGVIVYFLIK